LSLAGQKKPQRKIGIQDVEKMKITPTGEKGSVTFYSFENDFFNINFFLFFKINIACRALLHF